MSDMSGFLAAPYYYSYKRDAYPARCGATVYNADDGADSGDPQN